jgi:hypothetical protein
MVRTRTHTSRVENSAQVMLVRRSAGFDLKLQPQDVVIHFPDRFKFSQFSRKQFRIGAGQPDELEHGVDHHLRFALAQAEVGHELPQAGDDFRQEPTRLTS